MNCISDSVGRNRRQRRGTGGDIGFATAGDFQSL